MTTEAVSSGVSHVAQTLGEMIEAVDQLAAAIAMENQVLAQGFPASLSGLVATKFRLAERVADMLRTLEGLTPAELAGFAEHSRLLARVRDLEATVADNMALVLGSLAAGRRRVEAITEALREHCTRTSSYAADRRLANPVTRLAIHDVTV